MLPCVADDYDRMAENMAGIAEMNKTLDGHTAWWRATGPDR